MREEWQQIFLVLFDEVNATVFRDASRGLHVFALLAVLLNCLLVRVTDAYLTNAVVSKEVLGLLAHFLHRILIDRSLDKTRAVELFTCRVRHVGAKLGRRLEALALHQLAIEVVNELLASTVPRWHTCVQAVVT